MKVLPKLGRGAILELRDTVAEVLLAPENVFEGIRLESDEDRGKYSCEGWRCYAGRPSFRFNKEGQPVETDPEDVFVVFLNHDRVAYNWRWERWAVSSPAAPADSESRFKRCLTDA